MIDKISIGKIIKSFRKKNKLTQEELAEKIDVSKNYLSKIERGISVLNAETFLKSAKILNFSLNDFGIKTNDNIDENKKELINKILSFSDKEVNAFSNLLDTMQTIIKSLR